MGPPTVSPVEPSGTSRFQAELPDPQMILFCLHRATFFFLKDCHHLKIRRFTESSRPSASEVLRSELGGEGACSPQRQSCVPLPHSAPLGTLPISLQLRALQVLGPGSA